MSDTTVYTIFAGILPTLGFNKSDFSTERKGKVKRGVRGSGLGIRGVIGYDGSLRKARIKGSVAWYEYSTTVEPIHREVLGGSKDINPQELGRERKTFENKYQLDRRSLLTTFISDVGKAMIPTNKGVTGKPGTPSEQALGDFEHPDDSTLRKQGELIGKANAIDLYFRGKDGKIYRIDVTSMTMDDKHAHHGLTSFEDRQRQGVTSKQLLDLIGEGDSGIKKAQDRLLKYFQGTTEGYNEVIQRLKKHIRTSDREGRKYLEALEGGSKSLDNQRTLGGFKGYLKRMKNQAGKDPQDFLSKLRPAKKQAMTNIRRDFERRTAATSKGQSFLSAVSFALHSLGNVINTFRNNSAVKGGYSTEIRLGDAATNWTIEVKHRVHASGNEVLEFMKLKEGDVLLHNEAALQHVYMRSALQVDRETQNVIINETSRQQNEMHAAYLINKGIAEITIGGITDTVQSGLASDGQAVYHKATAVITPKDFNEKIEEWIKTTGTGQGWRAKVDKWLKGYIKEGDSITGYNQTLNNPLNNSLGTSVAGLANPMKRKNVYWGLADYLTNSQQDEFSDNVTPKWWGAPYISLLYPSGQVGSATK
tara:strand:- start:92 stop:1864 length:1773 start_codon:yes stop_codon:yes gene_type:complete